MIGDPLNQYFVTRGERAVLAVHGHQKPARHFADQERRDHDLSRLEGRQAQRRHLGITRRIVLREHRSRGDGRGRDRAGQRSAHAGQGNERARRCFDLKRSAVHPRHERTRGRRQIDRGDGQHVPAIREVASRHRQPLGQAHQPLTLWHIRHVGPRGRRGRVDRSIRSGRGPSAALRSQDVVAHDSRTRRGRPAVTTGRLQ